MLIPSKTACSTRLCRLRDHSQCVSLHYVLSCTEPGWVADWPVQYLFAWQVSPAAALARSLCARTSSLSPP